MLNPKKITAAEVMNEDLLTLREDTPIKEAMLTLEDYHITGAPVLNAAEECVGVFSSTDLLRRGKDLEEGEAPRAGAYFSSDPFSEDPDEYFVKEDYDQAILGRDTVGEWMTTEVRSVTPKTTLDKVCSLMVRDRIHRVLVMEGPRLRGIISSFDIVRLVAGESAARAPRTRDARAKR
jgi:CBS domain-containing protein